MTIYKTLIGWEKVGWVDKFYLRYCKIGTQMTRVEQIFTDLIQIKSATIRSISFIRVSIATSLISELFLVFK